jgi:hypothetical protein
MHTTSPYGELHSKRNTHGFPPALADRAGDADTGLYLLAGASGGAH